MAEVDRLRQGFTSLNASENDGDCEADPVPALWHQDDDDYLAESGFVERFWLPLAVAVLAGWGGLSFVLVNAFGWFVILAIAGVVIGGATAAIALVRAGDRNHVEPSTASASERSDSRFKNVA